MEQRERFEAWWTLAGRADEECKEVQWEAWRAASPPEAVGRWIDCKQELPPIPERVLTWDGEAVMERIYTKRGFVSGFGGTACTDVTYWRLYPAPPSGEQSQPVSNTFTSWDYPPKDAPEGCVGVRYLADGRTEYLMSAGHSVAPYYLAYSSGEQSPGQQGKASELARTDAVDETETVAPGPQEGREP